MAGANKGDLGKCRAAEPVPRKDKEREVACDKRRQAMGVQTRKVWRAIPIVSILFTMMAHLHDALQHVLHESLASGGISTVKAAKVAKNSSSTWERGKHANVFVCDVLACCLARPGACWPGPYLSGL